MNRVLDVEDVHKHFTLHLRNGLELPVLDGISLQVDAGECVALVGPSGRGKSTLMKCLYGSYAVDRGHLWLAREDGERIDLADASPHALIALRRREMAYVSQFLRALPRQSALDVVAERLLQADPTDPDIDADPLDDGPHEVALEAARAQVRALFARLNLPEGLWSLPPATFSGGEQQRVNIARGFITDHPVLLLDEPTASLDATNRGVVIGMIEEKKRVGIAMLGIFHDDDVRHRVADRVVDVTSFAPRLAA